MFSGSACAASFRSLRWIGWPSTLATTGSAGGWAAPCAHAAGTAEQGGGEADSMRYRRYATSRHLCEAGADHGRTHSGPQGRRPGCQSTARPCVDRRATGAAGVLSLTEAAGLQRYTGDPASAWSAAGQIPRRSHVRCHRPRRVRHRQRSIAQGLSAPGAADQRAGAGHGGAVGRGAAGQDRRVPRAPGRRRDAGRPAARGLRRGARGRQAHAGPAPFRRAAGRRHGAARRQDRRDEDRRGQDPGRHPAGLSQRARRQGRAHRHGERLPGPPRRRMDGPDLPVPRHDRRRDRARPGRRAAARAVRRRHHLRHQQRVRLRLSARQHEVPAGGHGPARVLLRHRRRGGQHPDRRGAHAADHLRARRRTAPTCIARSMRW